MTLPFKIKNKAPLLYFLLILLATPWQIILPLKLSFWIFSIYLYFILKEKVKEKGGGWWLIVPPLIVLLLTRIIPFLRWPAMPLGADSFTYKRIFVDCLQNPCTEKISIISNTLQFLGWHTPALLSLFYILINVLIGLALFITVKSYFNKKAAYASLFLFSISITQFLAYWAFYWKLMLAIALTLSALYLLNKKSWLVIPLAGIISIIHPAALLFLITTILISLIISKDRKYLSLSALGILLLTLATNYQETNGLISDYIQNSSQKDLASNTELTGSFIDLKIYQKLALAYLSFAALGLIKVIKERNVYPLAFFLSALILSLPVLYFHSRFIIFLDLALIILAAPLIAEMALKLWHGIMGKLILIAVFISLSSLITYQSWIAEPLITTSSEIKELEVLKNIEEEAIVLVNDRRYLPVVKSVTDNPVILADINIYEPSKPLYIYVGERGSRDILKNADLPLIKINSHLWKY
jgi:hypothetical protein